MAFLKIPNLAVGILYFLQRFLVKIFEPSSWDAALFGPNTFTLVSCKKSTNPSTNGCSGPTISKSIFFSIIHSLIFLKSLRSISKFVAI